MLTIVDLLWVSVANANEYSVFFDWQESLTCFKRLQSILAPDATFFHSAPYTKITQFLKQIKDNSGSPGRTGIISMVGIYPAKARLDCSSDAMRPGQVCSPDSRSKPIFTRVRQKDAVCLALRYSSQFSEQ